MHASRNLEKQLQKYAQVIMFYLRFHSLLNSRFSHLFSLLDDDLGYCILKYRRVIWVQHCHSDAISFLFLSAWKCLDSKNFWRAVLQGHELFSSVLWPLAESQMYASCWIYSANHFYQTVMHSGLCTNFAINKY